MKKTYGLALVSFIVGIFGLIVSQVLVFGLIVGIITLVFGIISLNKIKKDSKLKGKWMAITGIVLGGFTIIAGLALIGNISPTNLTTKHVNVDQSNPEYVLDYYISQRSFDSRQQFIVGIDNRQTVTTGILNNVLESDKLFEQERVLLFEKVIKSCQDVRTDSSNIDCKKMLDFFEKDSQYSRHTDLISKDTLYYTNSEFISNITIVQTDNYLGNISINNYSTIYLLKNISGEWYVVDYINQSGEYFTKSINIIEYQKRNKEVIKNLSTIFESVLQTINAREEFDKVPKMYGILKDDYSRIPKDCRFLVSAQTPATLVQNEKSFRVYRVELSKDEFYIIACDLENTKSYCDINAGGYTALTPSQCRMINPDNY